MSFYLAPIANQQQIDSSGNPLSGGKINTYVAGTSTPATTYTDDGGGTAQTNPIILNSRGLPANPVWLQGARSYKFVITDANDVVLQTIDDISGINDPAIASTTDQWVIYANAPTYINATSFSVTGDQTLTFQVTRRVRSANTGGTVHSSISASSYNAGTGLTTVTVVNDSGTLDSGLSQVSYGLLSTTNPAIPETTTGKALRTAATASAARVTVDASAPAFSATRTTDQAVTSAVDTKVQLPSEDFDTAGAFDNATNYRFTPQVAGYYQINGQLYVKGTNVTTVIVTIKKNGTDVGSAFHTVGATGDHKLSVSALVYLNGSTDYVELWGSGTGTSPNFANGSRLSGFLARAA